MRKIKGMISSENEKTEAKVFRMMRKMIQKSIKQDKMREKWGIGKRR